MSTSVVPLRQRAYDHIRQRLLSGSSNGNELLSEVALAKEIGISRTPVREAVTQLVTEGLLERIPSVGVSVKQITRHELEELTDLRSNLDEYVAGRAASRISDRQVEQLREIVFHLREVSRRLVDMGPGTWDEAVFHELAMTDAAFHLVLVEAAECPRVAKIIEDLKLLTQRFTSRAHRATSNVARAQREHWRLFQSMRRRDPCEAERLAHGQGRLLKELLLETYDRHQLESVTDPYSETGAYSDWVANLKSLNQMNAESMNNGSSSQFESEHSSSLIDTNQMSGD